VKLQEIFRATVLITRWFVNFVKATHVSRPQMLKSAYEWTEWAAAAFGSAATDRTTSAAATRRFLFRNVGDVYVLSTAAPPPGGRIRPLDDADVEEELARSLPLEGAFARPRAILQTVLDHAHTSYSHDLLSAARLQWRREKRVQQAGVQLKPPEGKGTSNGMAPLRHADGLIEGDVRSD
jgi:hypothetical protein